MPKKLLFLLLFAFSGGALHASFESREMGARACALGGAYVGLANDHWTVWFNPSGMARTGRKQLSFFYSPRPLGISELAFRAAVYSHPTKAGVFALSITRFGFTLYNETTVALSYANTHYRIVSFGLTVRYHRLSIERYGSAGALGLDAGVLVELSNRINVGFVVKNINSPSMGAARERLPQVISTGISYAPVERLLVLFDIHKDLHYAAAVRGGTEFSAFDFLAVRFGLSTAPSKGTVGLGLKSKRHSFDYALQSHPDLGFSHQLSVSLTF